MNRINVHKNEYGGYYQQYYAYYSEDPGTRDGSATAVSENGNGTPSRKTRINGNSAVVRRDKNDVHSETTDSFPEANVAELTKRASQEIVDDSARVHVKEERLREVQKNPENQPYSTDDAATSGPAISKKKLNRPPLQTSAENRPVTPEPAAIKDPRDGADPATTSGATTISEKTSGALPYTPSKNPAAIPEPASAKIMQKQSREGLSPELLKLMIVKLAEAMGPMAPLVLREHICALGGSSDSFPEAKLQELVKQVGKEILDDSFRQRFEDEMTQEIQRHSI